jgi:hypothetical protein
VSRSSTWPLRRVEEWTRRPGALPPMRMTASWSRSGWIGRIQVCGAIERASGELPSDHHSDNTPTHDAEAISRKARLAVHRPCACSGVKALRNTSCATAARRRAPLAFRSLDPFRALRDPERRRRDEERPSSSELRTASKGGSTARNTSSRRSTRCAATRKKPLDDAACRCPCPRWRAECAPVPAL